eukprot:gnl/TRDRNA2_/TRDRNA2_49470_c0_seq1.p1 gnl/TRDRNA2_/TRDRNA2_49470_c0~~gnl/TRDRNA2_/TRDRNA2_49470_c0_seq1.p1  ORF type:complete len:125 (-),score=26.93 gnl/TRDRNA2_/TRDRNA2_49470_c0_seq1:105-434(-)
MEKPPGQAHLNLSVGALLAIGGLFAYVKKGSVPSLLGGGFCGAGLIASGTMARKDPRRAFLLGTIVSAILSAGMIPRAVKTKKMMPAGMVALLGAIALLYNGKKLKEWS